MQDNKTQRFEDLKIKQDGYHEASAKFVGGIRGPIKGGHFPICHQNKNTVTGCRDKSDDRVDVSLFFWEPYHNDAQSS